MQLTNVHMIRNLKYKTLCNYFVSEHKCSKYIAQKKEKDKENELIFKSSISWVLTVSKYRMLRAIEKANNCPN